MVKEEKRHPVWDVHHLVAHAKEVLAHQRFRKEIGHVLGCGHEGDAQPTVLHALADEVVTTIDMFRPRVVLGVVGQV